MNFMGLLILPFKWGGQSSRHPRSGKAKVVTHGNLNVNKHATCDFKISSPFSFLLNVICVIMIMIIHNQIIDLWIRKSRKFFTFLVFLINHLVWRARKCRFIWSSDRLKPELRGRCSREKFVTVAGFKKHPRQKYSSAQIFLWWFSGMKWWLIKGN